MSRRMWVAGAAVIVLGTGGLFAGRLASRTAEAACCYFAAQEKDINQPGQKAFITWDPERKIESFTVQPKFEGNAVDFGMVIPTPAQPKLDEMPRDLFKDLAIYTILLPLAERVELKSETDGGMVGIGTSGGEEEPRPTNPPKFGVKILEAGVVGSLDYKIIVAEEATGLYAWLKDNQYVYSGNEESLDFYIRKKWFFTVMKIDPKQMKRNADGAYSGEVTPTRFTFSNEKCIYPLKITQISVKEKTDALFYVQSPLQMDFDGDESWMPSYRMMYLTYVLGCSANDEQQAELNQYNSWLSQKVNSDSAFETTKLEWARRLGEGDLATLDDPLALWSQGGGVPLSPGDQVISLETLLREANEFLVTSDPRNPNGVARRLKEIEKEYPAKRGEIVKLAHPETCPLGSRYVFYPKRDAPDEDVKGLSRLKGHLQKGQWLTKFRRIIRKEQMTDDLVLVPVAKDREQEFVRLLPTSPP